MHKSHNYDIIQISNNQNDKSKYKVITKFNNIYIYIYISPRKTLALKVKCNYNIFILRYLVLSIAFFLLFRCKSKIESTTRRKNDCHSWNKKKEMGFFVYLAFVKGFALGLLFSDWCLVGKWRYRLPYGDGGETK